MLTEEVKTFIEILYLIILVWTTESYERVPWQKTKNVWIGQPYNEAA